MSSRIKHNFVDKRQFQFWCHLLFRFDALSSDSLALVFPIPT